MNQIEGPENPYPEGSLAAYQFDLHQAYLSLGRSLRDALHVPAMVNWLAKHLPRSN